MTVDEILDFTINGQKRLRIVETGSRDTVLIAQWVRWNITSSFDSVSLDSVQQEFLHKELERLGLAKFCVFHTSFPKQWLAKQSWVDVIFIGAPDLHQALDEFLLSVSAGASTAIFRNYSTEAALAISSGKNLGWGLEVADPYLILRRPLSAQ